MNKVLLLLMFFLISCSSKPLKNNFDFFNNDLSFEEFKLKLEEYANDNPFPNINK